MTGIWQAWRDRTRASRSARDERLEKRKALEQYVRTHRDAVIDKLGMNVDRGEAVTLHLFADRILMIRPSRPEEQPVAGARARVEQGEGRELYITVEGPDFAWSFAPDIPPILIEQSSAAARAFAANVNLAGRRAAQGAAGP
ncbi:hypothetical protein [Pseudonocardia zijingensis]|uniref:Uncharacterized protein n=1 Tax=Pseudonocardia zijingensis TaxID=153376 RepID=A0ABN1PR59_9PSEU